MEITGACGRRVPAKQLPAGFYDCGDTACIRGRKNPATQQSILLPPAETKPTSSAA
jgi:hypothetical protein